MTDRMKAHRERMRAKGYVEASVWVHVDDRDALRAWAKRKRMERERQQGQEAPERPRERAESKPKARASGRSGARNTRGERAKNGRPLMAQQWVHFFAGPLAGQTVWVQRRGEQYKAGNTLHSVADFDALAESGLAVTLPYKHFDVTHDDIKKSRGGKAFAHWPRTHTRLMLQRTHPDKGGNAEALNFWRVQDRRAKEAERADD